MFTLNRYAAPASLDEAWQMLNKNKGNVILGGLLWMKMGKKQYHTGIDLKHLGLDRITETDDTVDIGAMVSFRQMETDPILSHYFGSLFPQALGAVVGIQFRHLATLGGSVSSRFGFSDLICALLCLETVVHLYHAGAVPLDSFLSQPVSKDILVKVAVKKQQTATSYHSIRKSATDFPILSVAAACCNKNWTVSVGARPARACRAPETARVLCGTPDAADISTACDTLAGEIPFGSDHRGSRDYRTALSRVLLKKGITQICR